MTASYHQSFASRPGILTAVAVFSLIIASVSLLVNFISFFVASSVTQRAMRRLPNQTIVATPPPSVFTPAVSEYVAPRGLSRSQRQIVIQGLSEVRPISDARQKQLDGLLADVGKEVIHLSDDNISIDRIVAYVSDARDMPASGGGPADDLFTLGSGRLQLSDQTAVFFPDTSPSPIRSRGGSYTDADGAHLASEQIDAVVTQVQSLCNHAMNDAQVRSLETELEMTTQPLITPSPSVAQAAEQVRSEQSLGNGTIAVTTDSSSMSFGLTGEAYPGIMPLGRPSSNFAAPRVARLDATLLMLETLLSFAAAGLLMAGGIMLLRNSAISRWILLGYSVGKLLLVCLSCYAIYSVAMSLNTSDPDAGSTAFAWTLIVGATGAIFPILLLIVMNLRFIREFLAAPTVGRIY